MYTGPLPSTTVYSSWAESIEIWDIDTDTQFDLTDAVEIKLILRDTVSRFDVFTLRLTDGSITVPTTGVIEWNVAASTMGTITPKTYEVILLLIDDEDTTVPVMLGSISIVE